MDTFQTTNENNTNNSSQKTSGSSFPIIIVILIVALGGIYFWYSRNEMVKTNESVQILTDEDLNKELNNSAELDISAELESINTDFE